MVPPAGRLSTRLHKRAKSSFEKFMFLERPPSVERDPEREAPRCFDSVVFVGVASQRDGRLHG